MVFAPAQPSFLLSLEEQKALHAFGRTAYSRKSNLAIESLMTPTQVDTAVDLLANKGLVKVKQNSEVDAKVYLTWKGGQVKREINPNVVRFPTTIKSNVDEKLKAQIARLKGNS